MANSKNEAFRIYHLKDISSISKEVRIRAAKQVFDNFTNQKSFREIRDVIKLFLINSSEIIVEEKEVLNDEGYPETNKYCRVIEKGRFFNEKKERNLAHYVSNNPDYSFLRETLSQYIYEEIKEPRRKNKELVDKIKEAEAIFNASPEKITAIGEIEEAEKIFDATPEEIEKVKEIEEVKEILDKPSKDSKEQKKKEEKTEEPKGKQINEKRSVLYSMFMSPLARATAGILLATIPLAKQFGESYREQKIKEANEFTRAKIRWIFDEVSADSIKTDSLSTGKANLEKIVNKRTALIKKRGYDGYVHYWLSPLKKINLLSMMGPRIHPIKKNKWGGPIKLYHDGDDLDGESGDSVMAAEEGIVSFAGNRGDGYGNVVEIRHKDGWRTKYAHLLPNIEVKVDDRVKAGDLIAYVGSTGLSTGSHLHLEMSRSGKLVEPIYRIKTKKYFDNPKHKSTAKLKSIISTDSTEIVNLTEKDVRLLEQKIELAYRCDSIVSYLNNSGMISLILNQLSH